jgi:hypothetical protein
MQTAQRINTKTLAILGVTVSPELLEILKPLLSALVASGLTLAAVAKFGGSWFFKKVDSKYAFKLAEKNNELISKLEEKKNDLNKELQIGVTSFKAQLEVLSGQQSKFLEKKVNSVLLLNQHHYLAVKNIKEFTDTVNEWINESTSYFKYQLEDQERDELSSYDVYRQIKEDRFPAFQHSAESAFKAYSECLALNMPILPKSLVEEELEILDRCRSILADTSMAFSRAMCFTQYIMVPEECDGTVDSFMNSLQEELDNSASSKKYLDILSSKLFEKSLNSGAIIESLLQHKSNG